MQGFLSALLAPTAEDQDIARRQRLLNIVLLGLAVPGFLFGLVAAGLWIVGRARFVGALAGLGVQPFYLLAYWLGRRERVRLAAYLPVSAVFLAMVGGGYQQGVGHSMLIGYAMATLTAGILIGTKGALLFALLSTISYGLIGRAQAAGRLPAALPPEETVIADTAALGFGLVVLVIFNWLNDREIMRALRQEQKLSAELEAQRAQLEQRVAERTRDLERRALQLEAAADVSQSAVALREMDELLRETVHLISHRFGFYHVALFLLGESGEHAVLKTASSEGGQRMLAHGYRLQTGSRGGIVGWVTAKGKPRVALDVKTDAVFLDNPDLPDTRSEMALPLRARGKIIGVLDVQSKELDAFDDEDVGVIQTLADQVAMSISNINLFAQVQESLEKERRTYGELGRESWGEMLRARTDWGYRYIRQSIALTDGDWKPEMVQAAEAGQNVQVDDKEPALAIPLEVRNQVVGVLGFRKNEKEQTWTDEEVALLETLTEELGAALESARLYQDTQRRAAREQALSEMTTRFSRSLDMDAVLQAAVQELGQLLDMDEISVYVGNPEEDIEHVEPSSELDDVRK